MFHKVNQCISKSFTILLNDITQNQNPMIIKIQNLEKFQFSLTFLPKAIQDESKHQQGMGNFSNVEGNLKSLETSFQL